MSSRAARGYKTGNTQALLDGSHDAVDSQSADDVQRRHPHEHLDLGSGFFTGLQVKLRQHRNGHRESHGGVLENVISLVGYERLCYMIVDEPDLATAIFDEVGQRLVRYYEISAAYDTVGMLMSNDDWGFNTQTMLSVDDMRKYVFPWHKKIVEVIHAAGKPALLHSCGNLSMVMDDVIDYMKYDAKHSYEDNIMPVEEAYERWGSRIAILGGIDVDFICRSTPEEVYNRACTILEKVDNRGGYALGSGNSIPYYVPVENYFAMISAAY